MGFFPLTEVSKSVSKEDQNSTLEAAILKLYLAARPCLCDVIPSNSKLAGSRKTCNWLDILHKGQQNVFFQRVIHFIIFTAIIFGVCLEIIRLKSSQNQEWYLKDFRKPWTNSFRRNGVTKLQPVCRVLFKMAATMSSFGLLRRRMS